MPRDVGRFISQDPAQDESNWYSYCGNNPSVAVDPSGENPVVLGAVLAAVVFVYPIATTDWGSHDLSPAQKSYVEKMKNDLIRRALDRGDKRTAAWLRAEHVTKIWNHQEGEEKGDSLTKLGRAFGLSPARTILSADFFDRSENSERETLYHEAYHAGAKRTWDTNAYWFASHNMRWYGFQNYELRWDEAKSLAGE